MMVLDGDRTVAIVTCSSDLTAIANATTSSTVEYSTSLRVDSAAPERISRDAFEPTYH
jgi:hypothetical protein